MALPPHLLPNSKITQHYLNALRETARRGNVQVAGVGLSGLDTPGGMLIQQNPDAEFLENCQRMQYVGTVTGATLLPGSLVHILDAADENGIQTFDVADYSGRQRLGVLIEGAAPGNCPWVQYKGIVEVLVDGGSWANAQSGILYRIGAKGKSPYGQRDLCGPLYSTAMPFSPEASLGVPAGIMEAVAFLEFRRAADFVHCVTGGGENFRWGYNVNSWIFSSAYQVGEVNQDGYPTFPDNGDIMVIGP